jgi:hypothetical protein
MVYSSVLKFWDTRNLKSIVTQACPEPGKVSWNGTEMCSGSFLVYTTSLGSLQIEVPE